MDKHKTNGQPSMLKCRNIEVFWKRYLFIADTVIQLVMVIIMIASYMKAGKTVPLSGRAMEPAKLAWRLRLTPSANSTATRARKK
uniref:hypothetical protein n=1 Tax=Peribacillus sedimenti TaxID=3115297 RepID=UPI003F55685B